ncbi:class III signal peptide-containing protein [Methanotorris igneus]|uniref:Class III signal peptide-containing protein n=1 Tax=Methanotorris igneus (strain DSM 5666 / JCM 11834 / Kol 5) TaxID=880724 RepID=F6BDF7_METIK|nr:class III signal peptide-containing protein [Methanotorris igneus]AEF96518.1 Class III signal peptide-containing protein [Methanotorris igneus Kol 5]
MLFKRMAGQISLEFSLLVLVVLVVSMSLIVNIMNDLFNEEERIIDKIDIAAKTAVSLVNSHYNGTYANETLIYTGLTYNESNGSVYVTIHIIPKNAINKDVGDFIINYIYDNQHINRSKYNISIY